MKTTNIKLTDIRPYWRNPRNNDSAVDAVRKSIEEFGFNSPLIVDTENTIIAGHTRYRALVAMGVIEVPCVIADLSPEQAKRYRIIDNKTSELAEWDENKLMQELREVIDIESMAEYFPDQDLTEFLQVTSGTMSFASPTADKIAKAQEAASTTFSDRSAEAEAAYVQITCPHCGEDMYVDKREIGRKPGESLANNPSQ